MVPQPSADSASEPGREVLGTFKRSASRLGPVLTIHLGWSRALASLAGVEHELR